MRALPGSGEVVRILAGRVGGLILAVAVIGTFAAVVIGIATAGLVLAGTLVAVTLVVGAGRWTRARLRRLTTARGVDGIRHEDRIDHETGRVRRTTVIDMD